MLEIRYLYFSIAQRVKLESGAGELFDRLFLLKGIPNLSSKLTSLDRAEPEVDRDLHNAVLSGETYFVQVEHNLFSRNVLHSDRC